MLQMSLNLLAPGKTQVSNLPPKAILKASTKLVFDRADLVDVTETAQDAGIPYKMAVTGELYDRLQRCHPGDPYENEIALWDVLWLGEFERTLNLLVSAFVFTATVPSTHGENERIRLRYVAGDPAVIEIAH